MSRPKKVVGLVEGLTRHLSCGLTLKMRIGWSENKPVAHQLIGAIEESPCSHRISAFMIHGRSRLQRYARSANWDYIHAVAVGAAAAESPPPRTPIIGNGDIMSFVDWEDHLSKGGVSSCCMLARGALIKPWSASDPRPHPRPLFPHPAN